MQARERLQAKALFNVEGFTAVVTGGAAGIGLAYAEVMAANGANVTLIDADGAALDAAVAALRAPGRVRDRPRRRRHRPAPRCTTRSRRRQSARAASTWCSPMPASRRGRASSRPTARAIPPAPSRTSPTQLWQKVLDTNLTGVFTTIRACVPPMKAQGGGSIIVTTSIAGLRPSAVVGTPYMIAKAGAAHLVRQAALELARYGIRVNAIAPGPFATRITSPELTAIWSRALPVGRIASTDEIKGLALYLASGASGFVTGAQFVIDGGSTLGRADPT